MSDKIPTPDDLKYGSITTSSTTPDGTVREEKETIYNGELSTYQVDLVKSFDTDAHSIMRQIIEALAHINKGETRRLDLTIVANEAHEPTRMTKRWVIVVDKVARK